MQRYYEIVRDSFGNLAAGCTVEVFPAGSTASYSTIFPASYNGDTPTTAMANPFTTSSDGQVAFAAEDGDYDIKISGSNLPATLWRYRVNLFDSTTATTVPVSSISLTMPDEFTVAGSPGTALAVTSDTQSANTFWSGPTSGGAATPAFRTLVAADVSTVAVDKTTNQTVAGNKTFSDPAVFNSTVALNASVTNNSTLSQVGTCSFGGALGLAAHTTFEVDGGAGWASVYGQFVETSVPALVAVSSGIKVPGFVNAASTEIHGMVVLPFGYKNNADFYPFVQWAPSSTNTGAVRWGLEYSFIRSSNQGTFPASTTITLDAAASSAATNQLYLSEFSAITATDCEPDTMFLFRLYRDGVHANDTFTGTALLCGFGLHIQMNRILAAKNRVPPFYS
jgi:hypothetical protein